MAVNNKSDDIFTIFKLFATELVSWGSLTEHDIFFQGILKEEA